MQDRRHRPGDVLDDYCPRERRITDHAIVAMIDDQIRQTRCGICDAEHGYKGGKVPPPRRKTQPPALFTQVLDNLNGSTPRPQSAAAAASEPAIAPDVISDEPIATTTAVAEQVPAPRLEPDVAAAAAVAVDATDEEQPADDDSREQGGFRRSLIRATFPRPEGQPPPPRALPEFTIQSLQNRRNNNQRNAGGVNKFRGGGGGRRRPGGAGGQQDNLGPMRFRDGGHGQNQNGDGRPQGAGGGGGGRRRRGGKKNR